MKYVLLAIFVLFATQPIQASECNMPDAQGTSHGQHGDMQDQDGPDLDCCDNDSSGSSTDCDSMSHCVAGSATGAAINTAPLSAAFFTTSSQQYLVDSDGPLSRFNSPPFRPPIT